MSTSATTTRDEDRRKSRKGIIGLAAMATAGALVVGLGFAYFSDSINFGGSATAGTLDLTSSAMVVDHTDGLTVDNYVTTGIDGTKVQNLNPGDVVRIAGDITNAGNKSAWIRTALNATGDTEIANDLYVYAGEDVPTQDEALNASDPTSLDGYVGTVTELKAAEITTPALIIAGNPTGTAPELDGTLAGGTSDNVYDQSVVVYFDKGATNETQNQNFAVNVVVEAVQYRNNPTPGTGDWAGIEQGTVGSGVWVPDSAE